MIGEPLPLLLVIDEYRGRPGALTGRRKAVIDFLRPIIPVAGRDGDSLAIVIEAGAQIAGVYRRHRFFESADIVQRVSFFLRESVIREFDGAAIG